MSVMYRIICRKLLVLIRLAIIVSLASYSLSNSAVALHIGPSDDHQTSVSQVVDAPFVSDNSYSDVTADNEDSKFAKQECSDGSCTGFVLVTFQNDSSGPVVSTDREFIDEHGFVGELPGLHRPPPISK